jgi:predicted DCC family thiol-disulfide oxidoreductase YuxK
MKTLNNHVILYDGECPMCSVYTQAFVKAGMLEKSGRADYQQNMDAVCPAIDRQRAVDEIALVDLQTGEVTYGIRSLFKVIGNACPAFIPLFGCKPFIWLTSKVYAFISYNRRVIIPAANEANGFAWQPSFKLHYRIVYLLFTWFCTGYILTAYAHLLAHVVPAGSSVREYAICGGQIFFQAAVISTFAREKTWAYLGNMMTISFTGSLLLLVIIGLNHLVRLPLTDLVVSFLLVAGLMLMEHNRRTNLLNLGYTLTISWVLYRIGLLLFIVLQ